MGVFGAVFGRRGDAGFKAPLLGVSSGVVGFNAAMLSRLVCEKLRPARPDVRASAKKFALRTHNGPKLAFSGVLGEFFAEEPLEGRCWASFFAPTDLVPVLDAAPCTSGWLPMGDLQH